MNWSPGSHAGPYEILERIGAGGMGEVFRARDERLGREVALKVLRAEVGDRKRFAAEAKAASSLNHPNIITVFDVGEEDGNPYIVSELLQGETLRAVLRGGALPLRKLLDIGVQIAAGLAAAHGKGLVHRDLKPENVMVDRDGSVKILDFGLAKPGPHKGGEDEETVTAHGATVGTPAYMSPEQAQGKEVDFRSDQFSFGLMLYEMATGTHPFRREDLVGTMAAIAKAEQTPIQTLNPSIPAPVRWVVDRCLAKEPAQRFNSTADLNQQLRDIQHHLSEVLSGENASGASTRALPQQDIRKAAVRTGIALVLLAAGAATGAYLMSRHESQNGLTFTPFAAEAMDEAEPAWAPDGKTIAYVGRTNGISQVFARSLDSPVPAQITHSAADCRFPVWSPDSSRLYYWSANSLWSVGAVGGDPQAVIEEVSFASPSASVAPDGATFAFFRRSDGRQSLAVKRGLKGNVEEFGAAPFPPRFRVAGGVQFSPDGKQLLVWLIPDVDKGTELWLLPFPSGTPRRVETPLLKGYRQVTATWMPDNHDVVVAVERRPGEGSHTHRLDTRTGESRPITQGTGEEHDPTVSPDGRRMAVTSGGNDTDLYRATIKTGAASVLLATARHEGTADWAPSGHQIAYVSDAGGAPEIWLRDTDDGSAMPIVRDSPEGHLGYGAPRFSPDGQRLAYMRIGRKHAVWISNLSGGNAVPLERESQDQHAPAWSPDGGTICYTRYTDGRWEIAKTRSGGTGGSERIAYGGGAYTKLEWSPTGEWIGFNEGEEVRLVSPAGGQPTVLWRGAASFTFGKDGKSVYVVQRGADRTWDLVTVEVPSGKEQARVALDLPAESEVGGARLHPGGDSLVVTLALRKRDIWIVDGLETRGWHWLAAPFERPAKLIVE